MFSTSLTINLRAAGFTVIAVQEPAAALLKARSETPALIILDLMLPRMSGLEICKVLKGDAATRDIPIIMLTPRSTRWTRSSAWNSARTIMSPSPLSPRELILRVNRSLRRGREKPAQSELLVVGELTLDHARHEVTVRNAAVELTATEFKLLALLMDRRGRVQGRDRLLNDVWGYESAVDTRTVDTHVRRLREKLGPVAPYIETVRGVGYRIAEAEPSACVP